MEIKKRVVKRKKLQISGKGYCLLIPKDWIEELDWKLDSTFILEFLPYRKAMILTEEKKDEEVSDIVTI